MEEGRVKIATEWNRLPNPKDQQKGGHARFTACLATLQGVTTLIYELLLWEWQLQGLSNYSHNKNRGRLGLCACPPLRLRGTSDTTKPPRHA